MKKLRAGLVAVLLASLSIFGVVVSAAPAQAWDTITNPNTPPPRIAPPPSTTIPNVQQPLNKPTIPPGLLGTAMKFLGLAGLGYMIGSTYRNLSCAGGVTPIGSFTPCTTEEGAAHDAARTSPLIPVEPLPDKVWCVFNGGCNTDGFALPTVISPDPGPNQYGQHLFTITGFTAPSSISATRSSIKGTTCLSGIYAQQTYCTGIDTSNQVSVEVRGSCRQSNGLSVGIVNTAYTPGTWLSGGVTGVGFNAQTRPSTPICPGTAVLEYLVWRDLPTSGFYNGNNGVWTNPNVDVWKNTEITSEVVCKNEAGQTATVTKTGPAGTGLAPVVTCPAGYRADSGSTSIGSGLLAAPEKVEEWSITPTVRETYPDCIGWQSAGCKLMIELDGVECTPAVPACRNWEEVHRYQPSRIKCKWGPYILDISHCQTLRQSYIGETGTVRDPKRDPLAAPIAVDPFGKPLQQNPDPHVPAPGTTPGTDPGADPGTDPGTNPGPAEIPQYGTDPNNPNPAPGPTTTPNTTDSNCWPGGTAAFNPLEWVLQPVKCALSWAFVPKQTVMETQVVRVQESFGKVGVVGAIGTVGSTINVVGAAAGSGSGCSGPTFVFDFNTVHQEMQPFNACSEPVATMALVSRSFTTVVVVVMGVLGMVRAAGAGVGFNFTMGRGGE